MSESNSFFICFLYCEMYCTRICNIVKIVIIPIAIASCINGFGINSPLNVYKSCMIYWVSQDSYVLPYNLL